MNLSDLEYSTTIVSNIMLVPGRLYDADGQLLYRHSPVSLAADPLDDCRDQVLGMPEDVGYYETDDFQLYGRVRLDDGTSLVIGPMGQTHLSELACRELGARVGVQPAQLSQFVAGMRSLGMVPRVTALQTLCALAFALRGDRIPVQDIAIHESEQTRITASMAQEEFDRKEFADAQADAHSSRDVEATIADLIRRGKPDELQAYLGKVPTVKAGTLAPGYLRSMKNIFIATATLASRAAIEGGMGEDEALSLSDSYINRCEAQHEVARIQELNWHMLVDYATRVGRLRVGDDPSPLVTRVANYVQAHLFEPIRTQDVADALFVSRGFLSTAFKRQTGMGLSEYIQRQKVEEAKSLLRHTSQSLLAISTYLGYSSQSHFSAVFKRQVGMTPGEWRAGGGS